MYPSLEDAMAAPDAPACLIPSHFILHDRPIYIGDQSDKSQCLEVGHSTTRDPHTYPFNYKNILLRLIDTPGIGDSEGIEQDKKNFAAVLQHLGQYKEVHAIWILLKPDVAVLTDSFKYCIGEMLTHLHRDAAKNILFCITHARGSNYQTGDTGPAVRKFIEEIRQKHGVTIPFSKRNTFCMDSESFRYLAAIKNGLTQREMEYDENSADMPCFEDNVRSWQRSEVETARMMKYIDALQPHRTNDTLSMNKARQIVMCLAKPLADITQNIQVGGGWWFLHF